MTTSSSTMRIRARGAVLPSFCIENLLECDCIFGTLVIVHFDRAVELLDEHIHKLEPQRARVTKVYPLRKSDPVIAHLQRELSFPLLPERDTNFSFLIFWKRVLQTI